MTWYGGVSLVCGQHDLLWSDIRSCFGQVDFVYNGGAMA